MECVRCDEHLNVRRMPCLVSFAWSREQCLLRGKVMILVVLLARCCG